MYGNVIHDHGGIKEVRVLLPQPHDLAKVTDMVYTSELIVPVAAVNVDLAVSGLVSLNNEKPSDSSPSEEKIEWAHFLCTYTRFIHLRTWLDSEPIMKVQDAYVPQFHLADESIGELLERKKEFGFSRTQVEKLKRYRKNLNARKMNLENNYCQGKDSAFDPGTVHPQCIG